MVQWLKNKEVEKAILALPNKKAAGPDCISAKLYKVLCARHRGQLKTGIRSFNIVKTLTMVFEDIERYRVKKDTKFVEEQMCSLYKKNDRANIANYRSITVLNSDYKIMTQALQNKLADTVPDIIHKNQ